MCFSRMQVTKLKSTQGKFSEVLAFVFELQKNCFLDLAFPKKAKTKTNIREFAQSLRRWEKFASKCATNTKLPSASFCPHEIKEISLSLSFYVCLSFLIWVWRKLRSKETKFSHWQTRKKPVAKTILSLGWGDLLLHSPLVIRQGPIHVIGGLISDFKV